MELSKTLFAKTTIKNIENEVELEYFQTKKYYENENKKYGIEVIKRETKNNQVYEEKKQINSVTSDEKIANKILDVFKKLQVTPITMEYVIEEFLK